MSRQLNTVRVRVRVRGYHFSYPVIGCGYHFRVWTLCILCGGHYSMPRKIRPIVQYLVSRHVNKYQALFSRLFFFTKISTNTDTSYLWAIFNGAGAHMNEAPNIVFQMPSLIAYSEHVAQVLHRLRQTSSIYGYLHL